MFFLPRAEINVLVIRTHIFSEKSGPGEANSTKMSFTTLSKVFRLLFLPFETTRLPSKMETCFVNELIRRINWIFSLINLIRRCYLF